MSKTASAWQARILVRAIEEITNPEIGDVGYLPATPRSRRPLELCNAQFLLTGGTNRPFKALCALQHIASASEVEMSEEKQAKPRRAAPPKAAPEPVAPVSLEPEPMAALPPPIPRQQPADKFFSTYWATLASIGASQAAIVSDVTAMALEMSGLARSNLTAAGDNVTALLGAKSLVDAVEIQLGFARRSLDAIVDGSTKLGEIGVRLANDAAKPVLGPLAAG